MAAALKSGFDREQIANVFLGGVSRVDACIQLSDAEFEDAIDGLEMLLADCATECSVTPTSTTPSSTV